MTTIEDLFGDELEVAAKRATATLPDVAAALDRLFPMLMVSGDRMAVRRYVAYVDEATRVLTGLPASHPEVLPPASVVCELLRRDIAELPWLAPTPDGLGVIMVLVDRLRGFAAGLPQECVRAPHELDESRFHWFLKTIDSVELEHQSGSPLRRAMTTLQLSSSDVADLMGVKRQAVDRWLLTGPPAERGAKIGAMAEIADLLRYRLRDGMPPVVVRRPAEAYGGSTMLDLIAQDEHEWLLRSVKESFDFARTA